MALFCLVACSAENDALYPLSSGRIWHYALAKTTMDGSIKQKFIVETLPEFHWQNAPSVPMVSAGGEQYLYQRSGDGIYRVAYKARDEPDFVAHPAPHVVLPKDIAVGNAWQQTSPTQLLENTGPPWETLFRIVEPVAVNFTIAEDDATVSVPAGKFHNCLRISGFGEAHADVGNYIGRTAITVTVEQWYAAGVGLVKSIRTETTTADAIRHGKLITELEYFTN